MKKYLNRMKPLKFSFFLRNIIDFFTYSFNREFRDIKSKIHENNQRIELLERDVLYFKLMDYYHHHPSDQYRTELDYLQKLGRIQAFPYKQLKTLSHVESGYDSDKKMPFIIHDSNKRVYFPRTWSEEQAKGKYIEFIESENILGGNYSEKAPHQYQSDTICVKKNDIVLDIGCAEALFALDVIDLAKKVYLIESDSIWFEPLNATFEPYKDKVMIIHKSISGMDTHDKIRLDTCLGNNEITSMFIKMDIEGYELSVLSESQELLTRNSDIRVACCTYHRQDDADNLEILFKNLRYETEFSDGYMLFHYDRNLQPPYFRKGVIRAKKIV